MEKIRIKRKQTQGFSSFGDVEISSLEGTIIAAFFPEAQEMTLREIKERVDYSYERLNSALKSLAEKKIVFEKQTGKTLIYSLDLQNLYVYTMGFNAYILERELDFIKKHKPIFNAIKKVFESSFVLGVILFGSYSKGTENKQSDVDLMITCIPGKEKEVETFVKSIKYETNIEFSLVVLPMQEFPNIKKDNPELWQDLKNFGIVFKGDDTFYHWMYEDE